MGENLGRFALEQRGKKVDRSKTQNVCVNDSKGSRKMKMQGGEVMEVNEFKYPGSTIQE